MKISTKKILYYNFKKFFFAHKFFVCVKFYYNLIKSDLQDYVESYSYVPEIGHKQKKFIGSRNSHLETD